VTPQDLIAAFGTVAEAPEGTTRLRELVKQLAVEGRLLAQDPSDEVAAVLLGRVAALRAEMVEAKKVRKLKGLPAMPAVFPFVIPLGWEWARLGDVVLSLQNGTSKRRGKGKPTVVLRLADITDGELSADSLREIAMSDSDVEKYMVGAGDVLAIRVNGSTDLVGRLIPVRESRRWTYCDHLIRISLPPDISYRYLCLAGEVREARDHFDEVMVTTAGQKTVNQTGLGSLLVPVPPLAEQHRIVARVEELMGLLDRLEAARDAREATRVALRDAALAALREADSADEVEVAWQRIAERMDDLFTDPADVEPLRQTVLQLAVRGRLVRQDADDEPATDLVEQAHAEKARLLAAKEIRKPKAVPELGVADSPFELASGWTWCRLTDMALTFAYGSSSKSSKSGRVPVLRMGNLQGGEIDWTNLKYTSDREEIAKYSLSGLSVLFNRTNSPALVGKTAVYRGDRPTVYAGYLIHVREASGLNPEYLNVVLNSPMARAWCWAIKTDGVSQSNISASKLATFPFPLPPLPEQARIVARVDELMGLLSRLAGQLIAVNEFHEAFANAAVRGVEA